MEGRGISRAATELQAGAGVAAGRVDVDDLPQGNAGCAGEMLQGGAVLVQQVNGGAEQ